MRSIMCFIASATKHVVLILTILTFLFLVTSDGAVLLPLLALVVVHVSPQLLRSRTENH